MTLRLRRLAGASPAALAVALPALVLSSPAAQAQSFDATGSVISGLATINTVPGQTQITIDSPEVVINWLPADQTNSGPILFQPGGTTAIFDTFISSNVQDYTVLNRIFPTNGAGLPINQPVRFAGTVESRVGGVAGLGHIWFFSPTGIIVGNGAAFNVGSLVLTTNAIDTTGGLYGAGGTIRFAGPSSPTGLVRVDPGASLAVGAGGNPSYIALVAPRIVQSGTINANGQVALVAAEQVDIAINTGLLDIVVSQGSEDANGIVHTGDTTGTASTALADVQQMQFVAIPKNTALTMLLSGSIGYAPAALASDDGSAIVLSAGVAANISQAAQDLGLGNIAFDDAVLRNVVTGSASNRIDLLPTGGTIDFRGGGALNAGRRITAIAETGEAIRATGNLLLAARRPGAGGSITVRAAGGAAPGIIAVSGNLALDASAFHAGSPLLNGADSLGGIITVDADGGGISAADLSASAFANGGGGLDSGGNGEGGSIAMTIANGGAVTAGSIGLDASAFGGNGAGLAGGSGTGGAVSLRVLSGSLTTGAVDLLAKGSGGDSSVQNASGFGGKALFEVLSGTPTMGLLSIDSSAASGEPFITGSLAGNARGGADGAVLHVGNGASLTVTGSATVKSAGRSAINPQAGGFGEGGEARVLVDGGGSLNVTGLLTVDAVAEISDESFAADPARTPRLLGGTASVIADGGTIAAAALVARSHAIGAGAVLAAGTATGGTSQVIARGGGAITVADAAGGGDLLIDAEGYGGMNAAPAAGQGGTAQLIASDGTITVRGTTRVSAAARDGRFSGAGTGQGYASTGGTALAEIEAGAAGTGRLDLAALLIEADGIASGPANGLNPILGNGGAGNGGSATLAIRAGTLTAAAVTVQATGRGGNAAAAAVPRSSGTGTGGAARLIQDGGTATTGTLNLLAFGAGGSWSGAALTGQRPADGGNGLGGNADALLSGGTLTAPTLLLDGSGRGGNGMANNSGTADPGGNGGSGSGGSARLRFAAGSTAVLDLGITSVLAQGRGGNGGASALGALGLGGAGTGGLAGFDAGGGGFILAGLTLDADGLGGNGATGGVGSGSGSGGTADFRLADSNAAAAFTRRLASLSLLGRGLAGTVTAGPAPASIAGAAAFTAQVASPAARLAIVGDFLALAQGSTAPAGNGFAASLSGQTATIGGNSQILTSRDVAITVGPGAVFDTAGTLAITTPRTVTSSGRVDAGGNVAILADLGMTMASLGSGGTTLLRAVAGPVAIGTDLRSAGAVTVLGRSVAITGTGPLTFADADATAGNLLIETAGNLDMATVDAAGSVSLASSAGNLRAAGAINGASIALQAGGSLATQAAVLAPGAITVTAGSTYTANALVRGNAITLRSADLAIAAGAQIGQRGTTGTVTLINAAPAGRTFLGGSDVAGSYSLSNAEAQRLFADSRIAFTVPASATAAATGDFIIGDLAMSYGPSGQVGSGGEIKVFSPARVAVNGQVRLTTSSAADLFSIDPTRIEVIGDSGGISMRSGAGALLGRLELIGDIILVGSGTAISGVDGAGSLGEASRLLDTPAAAPSDGGYLQAGDLLLAASSGIFIQNTGASQAFPARRGFSATSLAISTSGPATQIAINGQLFNAGGTAQTGLQTVQAITINGNPAAPGGLFDPLSTVNGCLIGRSCQAGASTLTQADIDGRLGSGSTGIQFLPVVELREEEQDNLLPLIDEPVTGVGNDDLWLTKCAPDSADCGQEGGRQ